MDSFDFDSVKAEKANAMLKYRRLRNVTKLFRFAELFLVLILFFWIFTHLPFAIQISGEYFRKISTVIASHLFVFLFCNAIIVILLFKSSQFSDRNLPVHNAETDIYEEFVKKSENNRPNSRSEDLSLSQEPEVVVYEDKQMICAANTLRPTCEKVVPTVTDSKRDSYVKVYRRSQSEKLNRDRSEKSRRILQRSDTEKCQQIVISGDDPAKTWYPEDELSNEDFQRTIEAFIARELRFRRQESLAIVLQDQN
ncbi:hypothetical protein AAG906_033274 [Vitis piasezkii]